MEEEVHSDRNVKRNHATIVLRSLCNGSCSVGG